MGMAGSGWVFHCQCHTHFITNQAKFFFFGSGRKSRPKNPNTHSPYNLISPTHKHFAHAGDKFDGKRNYEGVSGVGADDVLYRTKKDMTL